ncbi:DUF742 domain-containing protein [Quadrisphaera setariae]|uniref:DUF742 domain-containing protein n=1 Tax=Quadrisphaera setariae TaxID=2593304 RepID=A0A5C8ZD20_9ACTN|nr:DUF742 domain-containing protein [Quadrisphaera setariae]TXR55038.1 DUF742 domain-containing protein [Quadrisphaera setariae]
MVSDHAGRRADALDDHDDGEELPTVRPYAVAGGRRAPSAAELPLEALVQALGAPATGMTRECRSILELTASGWLSVAELSAHVRLPVPVARVVIADLQRSGAVRVHAPVLPPVGASRGGAAGRAGDWAPSSPRSVLESVLDGISSL